MSFCQSCGMPLDSNAELMGTNSDHSKNKKYCVYCYKDGNFTSDRTMEEMINHSLKYMKIHFKDDSKFNEEEMIKKMNYFFPLLERWKK